MLLVPFALTFLAADDVLFQPPSLFQADLSPRDGAVDVPTNALFFTDHPSQVIVDDVETTGFDGPGLPLDLVAGEQRTLTLLQPFLDETRLLTFTVGDVDDTEPPGALSIRGADVGERSVTIGIVRAQDNHAVAFYRVVDELNGGAARIFDDGRDGPFDLTLPVVVGQDDPLQRTMTVQAVDMAGNVGPSDSIEITIDVPPQLLPGECCASAPAPLLIALLALLRRRAILSRC